MSKIKCKDHLGNAYKSKRAMCQHYHMSEATFNERIHKKKWSLEKTLTTPCKTTKCYGLNGEEFDSLKDKCKYYGVKRKTYTDRIASGMTEAEALTPVDEQITDYQGIVYSSKAEMCKHFNISEKLYCDRMRKGWTQERALTEQPRKYFACTDYLGNEFPSVTAMCAFYGVNRKNYERKLRSGKTKKEALTQVTKKDEWEGLDGKMFSSQAELCRYYNIPCNVYRYRKDAGWNLEDILTIPVHEVYKRKNTITNKCKEHNISKGAYYERLRKGWTEEKALNTPSKVKLHGTVKCFDGKIYQSIADMCRHYGIKVSTYRSRIKRNGMTQEEALMTPVKNVIIDPTDGEQVNSYSELCRKHNIDRTTFDHRINKSKMSIEDALTMPVGNLYECQDFLGNTYRCNEEMCDAYDMPVTVYRDRIYRGMSNKEALTTPINESQRRLLKRDAPHMIGLYRFIDKNGEIIYLGSTLEDLRNRLFNHDHLPKECYDSTEKIQIYPLNNKADIVIAEVYCINKYHPKYNGTSNTDDDPSSFISALDEKGWIDWKYDTPRWMKRTEVKKAS